MNGKSKFFFIRLPYYDSSNDLYLTCDDILCYCRKYNFLIEFYAFIKHDDKDFVHYHLLLCLKENKLHSVVLNSLFKFFKININLIECKIAKDYCSCARYLLHLDSKEKVQYDSNFVFTSSFDIFNMLLSRIYYYEKSDLSISDLIDICSRCSSLREVYLYLGLDLSKKYRNLIIDIYHDLHYHK